MLSFSLPDDTLLEDVALDFTLVLFMDKECEASLHISALLQSEPSIIDAYNVIILYEDVCEDTWLDYGIEEHDIPCVLTMRDGEEIMRYTGYKECESALASIITS